MKRLEYKLVSVLHELVLCWIINRLKSFIPTIYYFDFKIDAIIDDIVHYHIIKITEVALSEAGFYNS